jgi:hypothetical protein
MLDVTQGVNLQLTDLCSGILCLLSMMYLTSNGESFISQLTVIPLLLMDFLNSTCLSAICENYDDLGNEKLGQHTLKLLKTI